MMFAKVHLVNANDGKCKKVPTYFNLSQISSIGQLDDGTFYLEIGIELYETKESPDEIINNCIISFGEDHD